MNTPAHALLNLALLSRRPASHAHSGAIIVGAVIPDIAIILFYAWHLLLGTGETQIWSVEYYRPLWQAGFDAFNSIPLMLIAMLLCWKLRHPLWLTFFASMLLHCFGDLPLHHDDAHRHFFPLSDWRFSSPVSYWDPAHYGQWASLAEIFAVAGASLYLTWRAPTTRLWVWTGLAIYLLYWMYVLYAWV